MNYCNTSDKNFSEERNHYSWQGIYNSYGIDLPSQMHNRMSHSHIRASRFARCEARAGSMYAHRAGQPSSFYERDGEALAEKKSPEEAYWHCEGSISLNCLWCDDRLRMCGYSEGDITDHLFEKKLKGGEKFGKE